MNDKPVTVEQIQKELAEAEAKLREHSELVIALVSNIFASFGANWERGDVIYITEEFALKNPTVMEFANSQEVKGRVIITCLPAGRTVYIINGKYLEDMQNDSFAPPTLD